MMNFPKNIRRRKFLKYGVSGHRGTCTRRFYEGAPISMHSMITDDPRRPHCLPLREVPDADEPLVSDEGGRSVRCGSCCSSRRSTSLMSTVV